LALELLQHTLNILHKLVYPFVLLQIGTMSGQAYIFDLLSDASVLTEGKLKKILESEEIVKVSFWINCLTFPKTKRLI